MRESGVASSLPYISLVMSFVAISITMIIFVYNLINGVFSEVNLRNQFFEVNQKLERLQTGGEESRSP